jgi:hypothetical protein
MITSLPSSPNVTRYFESFTDIIICRSWVLGVVYWGKVNAFHLAYLFLPLSFQVMSSYFSFVLCWNFNVNSFSHMYYKLHVGTGNSTNIEFWVIIPSWRYWLWISSNDQGWSKTKCGSSQSRCDWVSLKIKVEGIW